MENILLTGYKSESIIDKKFNTHYLVKQTCELGKSIYEIIKEAEEKYSIYNVDMTIKIDNPKDKKTINKFLLIVFTVNCSFPYAYEWFIFVLP